MEDFYWSSQVSSPSSHISGAEYDEIPWRLANDQRPRLKPRRFDRRQGGERKIGKRSGDFDRRRKTHKKCLRRELAAWTPNAKRFPSNWRRNARQPSSWSASGKSWRSRSRNYAGTGRCWSGCTIENSECTFLMDNEAVYDICKRKLDIPRPGYNNLNRLNAWVGSSLTTSLHFNSDLNIDLNEFQTNLVPFPCIYYPLILYTPVISSSCSTYKSFKVKDLTLQSVALLYQGDMMPHNYARAVTDIKAKASFNLYMGEGMEEGKFSEARENLAVLEKDYEEIAGDTMGLDSYIEHDIQHNSVDRSQKYDTASRRTGIVTSVYNQGHKVWLDVAETMFDFDKRTVPSRERYARLEQYIQSLESALVSNSIELPQQPDPYPTPRSTSMPQNRFERASTSIEREVYSPAAAQIDYSAGLDSLSDRFGSLQLAEDGQMRFFGATSNLHILHVGMFPLNDSKIRSVYGKENDILQRAGLSAHIPEGLEDHLLQLYFCWENPNIPVVDQDVFYAERAKYRATGRLTDRYSETLANAMWCAVGAALTQRHSHGLPEPLSELFSRRAQALLDVEMDAPALCTVQSLVILSGVEAFLTRDARGWLYSGI
ncbi:hypothetical protein AN5082.2 [Aspergillus nidulans FGSC A4]|nr:hypothetical protein AN5082.2 [Aspergillus nidulans FGSC A4]|eukprot:XP_662686.1 hypothetical protein AN5082.2 [Aspergillus nidulans FGSC A4]